MYASSCICARLVRLVRCFVGCDLDQRVLVVLLEDDVVFAAVGGGRGREERGRDLGGERRGRRGRGRRGGGRRGGRRGRHAQPGDEGRSGVRRANKTQPSTLLILKMLSRKLIRKQNIPNKISLKA